jgi:penicillin-binding protein 1A
MRKHKEKHDSSRSSKKSVLKMTLFLVTGVIVLSGLSVYMLHLYINSLFDELPKFERLEKYEPNLITKAYSADGVLIKEFFSENRSPVDLDQIPEHVIQALISTEDRDFFNHWGFNSRRTTQAAIMALPRILVGKNAHGASTITQQLARNLYNEIGFKKSLERKLKELLTSIELEKMYSKKEILEMYMVQCLFGEGTYGIQSSAKMMFGKPASDLKIEESALLIAQLKAPAHYNPFKNPERAIERRNQVMYNMYEMDFITEADYDSLKEMPLVLNKQKDSFEGNAPYFTEHVRQQLRDSKPDWELDYLKDGLTVYTTLDSRIQAIADTVVQRHLPILNKEVKSRYKKSKWKGLRKYVRANYDSSRWKFKMKDTLMFDSLAHEKLEPQVALIAVDPKTGQILAMVGGTDFKKFKFNNALQAWRQPGSIFKPIVYLTALDNGSSPATNLINQPVVVTMPNGSRWQPGNYDIENMGGYISLREALRNSTNLISVRLVMELISPKEVISYAEKLGINTRFIEPYNSIALGAGAIRPIDIITAYSTIANKGTYIKPFDILKVEDKNKNVIYQSKTERSVAISEETSYLITNMMEDVVDNGTAKRLRWHNDFRYSVAGKTGTTNDFTDTWFCGFTPKIAIVVWVGLEDPAFKLGEGASGSNTALPIWGDFITEVYKSLRWKDEPFIAPEGVIEIETCTESMKPSGPYCPKTYLEKYNRNYMPTIKCDIHASRNVDFKKKDGRY